MESLEFDKSAEKDAIELLALFLLNFFSIDKLRAVASKCFIVLKDTDKSSVVASIIESKKWSVILDALEIRDFRICSKCGSLMHQGFCFDMGNSYYCSNECMKQDFTMDEWIRECEINDQSYWTDWFEHYELTTLL